MEITKRYAHLIPYQESLNLTVNLNSVKLIGIRSDHFLPLGTYFLVRKNQPSPQDLLKGVA